MANNIDIVIQARDQASATINNVSSSLNSIGQVASDLTSSMGMLGQIGLKSLTVAFEVAENAFVMYNAKQEQVAIGFTTMLGSAAAAQTFMAQLSKFAADTSFDLPGLQQSAQKMLAFGWAANDVIPTLTAIGDAATGLGIGEEGINKMTSALGQMKAKGVADGDDILQLAETGLPVYQILADKLHLTDDQLSNIDREGIQAETVIKALTEGMEEHFGGMMTKQSESFLGMASTIKENAASIFGGIGEPLFESLKGPMTALRNFTNQIANDMREGGFSQVFENIFPPTLADMIARYESIFVNFYSNIANMAMIAGERLSPIWDKFCTATETVAMPIINDLLDKIYVVYEVLTITLGTAIDIAVAYIEYSAEYIEDLSQVVNDTFTWIADFITETWQSINNDTNGLLDEAYTDICGAFASIGETINSIWQWIKTNIWAQVRDFVAGILQYLGPLGTYLGKVGNSLGSAWDKLTMINPANSNGNSFRDLLDSGKKTPEESAEGLDALRRHKGNRAIKGKPVIKGGDSGAKNEEGSSDKLVQQIDKMTSKVNDTFDKLNSKILEETGTTYQIGMAKINDEIAKMQHEVIDDANNLGIDTSALQDKMEEYASVMTEPIKRKWREAWQELKNNTALGIAQLTGDKAGEAAANESIGLEKLEKEKCDRLKNVEVDGNDEQAKLAVEVWYNNQVALLAQKRAVAERQGQVDIYNNQIEQNGCLVTEHKSTQAEIDKFNRQILDKKIQYLQEELNKEGLTTTAILGIHKELADAQTALNNTPLTNSEGIKAGLRDYTNSIGSETKQWQAAAKSAASSMNNAFSNLFFDAMQGKLQSLGSYLGSFLQSVQKAIAEVFAQQATAALIKWILPGHAAGGRASLGETFIAGERGPELISLDGSGASITSAGTTARKMGNGGNNVTVNVINQTSQEVMATQSAPSFDDFGNMVIDVVMSAVATNKKGMRTALAGAR